MPEQKLLLPKFLTQRVAEAAIFEASNVSLRLIPGEILTHTYHIVVLVPAMKDDDGTDWPNYPVQPYMIAEGGSGGVGGKYDFANIARCKALQLWTGRNDGSPSIMPHLLFPGDTPFWGGVKRDGIVVTCSGFDEWHDKMISGVTADICIGLAYDAWMKSADKADGELCFLT